MKHRKFTLIYILLLMVLIGFLLMPIMIKVKLKDLKAKKNHETIELPIREEEKVSISLNEVIEIIEGMEGLEIEEFNLSEEEKEVRLRSKEDIHSMRRFLRKLKSKECFYHFSELEYVENIWKIRVAFR